MSTLTSVVGGFFKTAASGISTVFAGIAPKVIAALVALIILMGGAGYFYVKYSQHQISTLTSNVAKIQTAFTTQTGTIKALQDQATAQAQQVSQMQSDLSDAETQERATLAKYKKLNIPGLAHSDSNAATLLVNKTASDAFNSIQTLSSIPVTK